MLIQHSIQLFLTNAFDCWIQREQNASVTNDTAVSLYCGYHSIYFSFTSQAKNQIPQVWNLIKKTPLVYFVAKYLGPDIRSEYNT